MSVLHTKCNLCRWQQGDLMTDTDPDFLLTMKLSLLQCHSSCLCERTYREVHFFLVLRIKSYSKIMKFSTLDWNIYWVKSERAQLDIVDSKIFSRSQVLPAQILVSPGSTCLLTHRGPNLGCSTIRWLGAPDPLVDWDTNCSEDHNHGQVRDVAQ